MAQVGCYSLDLYCDHASPKPDYGVMCGSKGEFTGQTLGECKKDARLKGWQFSRDGRAYCPNHPIAKELV